MVWLLRLSLLFLIFSPAYGFSLKKRKIKIKEVVIQVEIADTEEAREHGLMERTNLPEDRGMLFVFPSERKRFFWMKNTYIPLSIGFFDKNKVLIDVQEMRPMSSPLERNIPRYQSRGKAQYALEVPRGFFKKHKIKRGDRFEFLPQRENKTKD
ncbi:MAG: DUF192 domain-containing protein [Bdellovibrio sp.]|nr:MAG: DUF192 domain-containing protein [Bdellovibrio sp.]